MRDILLLFCVFIVLALFGIFGPGALEWASNFIDATVQWFRDITPGS